MKRLCFVSVLMLLAASGASAQQYRTSYFMEGSTMRGYLNPALRPDRGYVYIPVLGTTSVNFNSNALTFKTIFYPVGDNGQLVSLLDDRVTWHDIEPNLKTMNKVGFDLHMTLLGAGFYTGRDFWTIEAGLDVTGGFYLPKSFVEFVKLGSKANAYDMGGLMAGADAVMNISAGYSRRINDELTVGGRVNFKGGLARANMNYDRLNVTLNGEKWAVIPLLVAKRFKRKDVWICPMEGGPDDMTIYGLTKENRMDDQIRRFFQCVREELQMIDGIELFSGR